MLKAQRYDEPPSGLELRTLTLPDGTQMRWREAGSGPALLLVHGWGASGRFFENTAASLANDFHLIIPDLRGHGGTPVGAGEATIEQLADDLDTMIQALELDGAVALGWSMGALVLWRMIERHGTGGLAGMIVEDMSPRILNGPGWSLGMANGLDADASARAVTAMRADWPAYARAFAPHMFARGRSQQDPELVDYVVDRLMGRAAEDMAALWASMAQQDLRPALPAITIPVLVTYGERSQAYGPETSQYLVDTLPDASLQGFARSGHTPHLEEPEEFTRAISRFAQRVQAGAKTDQTIEGSIS